jgi:demethoxyubiquinone hydroxylase (CLK1/Coq7/Cat5 family)
MAPEPKILTPRDPLTIARILKVNHAGEYGAIRIYGEYKHPTKRGRVAVAGKLSDELAPGTLDSILKQAGLKEKQ